MNLVCGFASVNSGKHCFIAGSCVSCRVKEESGWSKDVLPDISSPEYKVARSYLKE